MPRFLLILELLLTVLLARRASSRHLQVFIIAHSHCDPGWLDTFDVYYQKQVHQILSSVTRSLQADSRRKFVWAEISFFSRWFESLDGQAKMEFRKLLQRGQWEFVGGGWVQNDEANPSIYSTINQNFVGHNYLLQKFGIQPRIAWQIDPFGHSAITPSLFRRMGYEALVINRIHFARKEHLKIKQDMEFMWNGAPIGCSDCSIFTHVLHTHYSAPKTFDWEENYPKAPIIQEKNIESRANELVKVLRRRANAYRTPHLLVPFGDDFKFRNADIQFSNMDKLIDYINKRSQSFQVDIKYATLSDYFQAISNYMSHLRSNQTRSDYAVFEGDFFPYADNDKSYWTGYFTSRPTLKSLSRTVDSQLHAAELFFAFSRHLMIAENSHRLFQSLKEARESSALFLHHDAITGTARTHVVNDYISRMSKASMSSLAVLNEALNVILSPNSRKQESLDLVFESSVLSTGKIHRIVLTNPLNFNREELICLYVSSIHVSVKDSDGNSILSQLQYDFYKPTFYKLDEAPSETFELCFVASIPSTGFNTYFVRVEEEAESIPSTEIRASLSTFLYFSKLSNQDLNIDSANLILDSPFKITSIDLNAPSAEALRLENQFLELNISPLTGLLEFINHKKLGHKSKCHHSFVKYQTKESGAYIFRPLSDAIRISSDFVIRIIEGPLYEMVYTHFSEGLIVKYVLIKSENPALARYIHIKSSLVAEKNFEVCARFELDIRDSSGNGTSSFYTHNGMNFIRRPLRFKPQCPTIQSSFFPVVGGVRLSSISKQLTVYNSHTFGGSSPEEGVLELMHHRNLNQDDGRGLGQPVDDGSRVDISYLFLLEYANDGFLLSEHSKFMLRLNNPILMNFGFSKLGKCSVTETCSKSLISSELSFDKTQVLLHSVRALESFSDDIQLILQDTRAPQIMESYVFDIEKIFENVHGIEMRSLRETTLTSNYELEEYLNSRELGLNDESFDFQIIPTRQLMFTDLHDNSFKAEGQNSDEEGVFVSDIAKKMELARRLPLSVSSGVFKNLDIFPGQFRAFIASIRSFALVKMKNGTKTTKHTSENLKSSMPVSEEENSKGELSQTPDALNAPENSPKNRADRKINLGIEDTESQNPEENIGMPDHRRVLSVVYIVFAVASTVALYMYFRNSRAKQQKIS